MTVLNAKPVNIKPSSYSSGGKINAIRVYDYQRDIWYSWDNGTWDNAGGGGNNAPVGQAPQVKPGYVYIAVNAVNQGAAANYLTISITNASTGAILGSRGANVPTNGNINTYYDGTMPNSALNIRIDVYP